MARRKTALLGASLLTLAAVGSTGVPLSRADASGVNVTVNANTPVGC